MRWTVGNQATGSPQVDTEMAAPPELRTPMGTCGEGRNQSADGSMATVGAEVLDSRRQSERGWQGMTAPGLRGSMLRGSALEARMRRCLKLRQGASPLRPPAPFPSESMFQNGGNLSRVRKPRTNRAPLTDSLRSENLTGMRERGPTGNAGAACLPLVGPEKIPKSRAGKNLLDRDRPSHGSRDHQGAVAGNGFPQIG